MSNVAPDPERQADRRVQLRLGFISVGTTMLVAIASLAGVYLGTQLQSQAQEKSIAAQSELASRQYLRDQRRQAYGDLLSANRELLGPEQDLLIPSADTTQPVEALRADAIKARRSYYLAEDVVKVVGPESLLAVIQKLRRAHVMAAIVIGDLRANPEPTMDEKEKYRRAMTRVWDVSDALGKEFRRVLAAND